MRRSVRTSTPASSASRTSTSVVLPGRTGTRRPSFRTSMGPSTEISSTYEGYGRHRRVCQRDVSASSDGVAMQDDDPSNLIHQLVVGDANAVAAIVEAARSSDDVTTSVAGALFAPVPDELLARATALARTSRDRQLVAIVRAHLTGDHEHVDAMARDHLADHPDSVLVAWIAANPDRTTNPTRKDQS